MATEKKIDLLALVRAKWAELSSTEAGREEFSRLVGKLAPYKAPLCATITELGRGYAEGTMPDRPEVRNHIGSIDAIALANFAELVGNLALVFSMQDGMRFIIRETIAEYHKKARGMITAHASLTIPFDGEEALPTVNVCLYDNANKLVAEMNFTSKVGPN